jgi:D-inositol-3-phosphate glycosyltransferase
MRIALVSAHTSPAAQPGTGDAGGMNVYLVALAERLRARRHQVTVVAESQDFSHFDVVHSHYWRSGLLALGQGVPWVHSMHTMGLVKNADGANPPEPTERIDAEHAIVRSAAGLVANTAVEAEQLVQFYGADPARVHVVHPGVDHAVFRPRPELREDDLVVFAGRIQPLKAPDVVLRAVALLGRRVRVVVIGGQSGSQSMDLRGLAASLGVDATFLPALPRAELAGWLAAATVVCVPSRSESFALIALEAQACGTPVVATRVGGLPTAVVDGVSGVLVDGREPRRWAHALDSLLVDRPRLEGMRSKALAHAEVFSWDATAEATLEVYESAMGPHPTWWGR